MPMVMMVLSTKDHRSLSQAWRAARSGLHPGTRRRLGLRGRSSLMRELTLWGFEQASHDPEGFLRYVRDTRDPLFGRADGRRDLAAERREALVESWAKAFGNVEDPPSGRRSSSRAA